MGVSCSADQLEKVSAQLTLALDKNLDNQISFKQFFLFVDQFFYLQLRTAAQTDPEKEDLLYSNAQVVSEVSLDGGKPSSQFGNISDAVLREQDLVVRDNGTMAVQGGQVVQKKLQFSNSSARVLNLRVQSNLPSVLQVKTPSLCISPNERELIKLQIIAPQTECTCDLQLLLVNADTEKAEELVVFKLDV